MKVFVFAFLLLFLVKPQAANVVQELASASHQIRQLSKAVIEMRRSYKKLGEKYSELAEKHLALINKTNQMCPEVLDDLAMDINSNNNSNPEISD